MPWGATVSALTLSRTRPRTLWPSAMRADATALPIKPFAPVTKTRISASRGAAARNQTTALMQRVERRHNRRRAGCRSDQATWCRNTLLQQRLRRQPLHARDLCYDTETDRRDYRRLHPVPAQEDFPGHRPFE